MIAQDALALVLRAAAADVAILDLVKAADELIVERTSKVHVSKKGMSKGIAFPTSINVNNIVGHFAPMEKDQDQPTLSAGDIVKVDLGVQIDGYVAVVAQTFAVPAKAGSAQTTPITGRAADAYAAALVAADAALKLLRVGRKNTEVSEVIAAVCKEYGVSAVQGVLSHTMPRGKIDGARVILNRLDPEQRVEEVAFREDEVWAVDIVVSTGEGKPKETDNRQTTIYKRNGAVTYSLKSNTARNIFKEIIDKHSGFPFSLRYLSDAGKARFGISEAREHDLVAAYPVLHEKEGEFVAQVKFTALISANGTTSRITGPVGGIEVNPNVVQASKKFKDYSADLQSALKALTIAPAAASAAGASGDAATPAAASGSAGANAAKNAKKKAAAAKKKAAEAAAGGAAPAAEPAAK